MLVETESNEDILKALAGEGLARTFNQNAYGDETMSLRGHAVSNYAILEDHYQKIIDSGVLSQVFQSAKENGVPLADKPFWKGKIKALSERSLTDCSPTSLLHGRANDFLYAANLVSDFDWPAMFHKVSAVQNDNGYIMSTYPMIAKKFAECNSMEFKFYVDNSVLSNSGARPKCSVRGYLYKNYVEGGFLTKKSARKMRSDGAEVSSLQGLKALTSNLELYPNSDELLLQFTDSKYEGVIMHLVDKLPEYLLTSVMGTEFMWAKARLERRIEAIDLRKSQEADSDVATNIPLNA